MNPFKIVLTGPESTGKTTLAQALAAFLGAPFVEEYARTYLEKLNRPYQKKDLRDIASGQIEAEETAIATANGVVILDTDLLTIKVWSEQKFGTCDPWILEQIEKRGYDHYFLCGTDLRWTFDPLRENPDDREMLFECYKTELIRYEKAYFELWGDEEKRLSAAIGFLKDRWPAIFPTLQT